MEELLNKFEQYELMLNKSIKTIDIYKYEIKRILDKYEINTIEGLQILENRDWLLNTFMKDLIKDKNPATVNRIKNTLSSFCKFLVINDIISKNKVHDISDVKVINHKIETFTNEEVESILNYMNNRIENNNFNRKIDLQICKTQKICVLMMLRQGLRISEVCSIRLDDIDMQTGIVKIHGKGGNGEITRKTVLNKEVKELLKDYLIDRESIEIKNGNNILFISNLTKKPFTPNGIRKYFKKVLDTLGIENKTPHSCRHFTATNLISKGVELEKVAKFMGHQNSSTTEKYYIKGNLDDLEEMANI